MMIDAGLQPLEPYIRSGHRWRCKCLRCGREVTTSQNTVRSGGGCRFCNVAGFQYDAPATIYLLQSSDFFCLKLGVTTTAARSDRIEQHSRRGWALVKTWEVGTGDEAISVEDSVLAWWRDVLGAPPALVKSQMPQGGWTETAALIHVDIDETVERIQAEVDSLLADAKDERPAQR